MKNEEMALLFSEATPYIQKYHGKTLVIKYGGNAFARVSLSQIAEQAPGMNVLQLPYLYRDSEHMWRVLDGEILRECARESA